LNFCIFSFLIVTFDALKFVKNVIELRKVIASQVKGVKNSKKNKPLNITKVDSQTPKKNKKIKKCYSIVVKVQK